MIPKRTKDTDIATDIARGKKVKERVLEIVEKVTGQFMQGKNLNEAIAQIAMQDASINRVLLQRIVEEANTIAYNKRYETVKHQKDRRIEFELAQLDRILEIMGDKAPVAIDNPNWMTGPKGDGEMQKSAKYETLPLHRPLDRTKDRYDRQMQKIASAKETDDRKRKAYIGRFVDSSLFKLASSLIQSEKLYKNANYIFNTFVTEAEWNNELTDQLVKKANVVAEHAVRTRRARPNFKMHLSLDHHEKASSYFLGEHSLLKTAEEIHVTEVRIAPTADISTYKELIDLAKKVKKNYENEVQQP